MNMDIVVARYNEDITWLKTYGINNPDINIYIYNDGATFDAITYNIIHIKGDNIPAESTKYLLHIINNYDYYEKLYETKTKKFIIFTQANPFDHSPDFIDLLDISNEWEEVQPLTLYGVDPIINNDFEKVIKEEISFVKKFSNNSRIWYDLMDESYQGINLPFDWWNKYISYLGEDYFKKLWYYFGFQPVKPLIKVYAACFAVTPENIVKYPKKFWQNIYLWVLYGDNISKELSIKDRAIILEYTWYLIFTGEYIVKI